MANLAHRCRRPLAALASLAASLTLTNAATAADGAVDKSVQSTISGLNKAGGAAGWGTVDQAGNSLPRTVGQVIGMATSFIGVLLACYFIYAGYLWTTAQGDQKRVDEAKTMIKNAIVGAVVLLGAYAITEFIVNIALKSAEI